MSLMLQFIDTAREHRFTGEPVANCASRGKSTEYARSKPMAKNSVIIVDARMLTWSDELDDCKARMKLWNPIRQSGTLCYARL